MTPPEMAAIPTPSPSPLKDIPSTHFDQQFNSMWILNYHPGVQIQKLKNWSYGGSCPLVSGFLTVATEAFDDGGHAHCSEHLVFLGSENYPYKGVLDSFATRAFARGTNAWTDIDHTCYNIMTAGGEGFLRFLPVYVDHILYPTLTESGFCTEIHHINGSGEDAGGIL
ncbi:unnamed protein product [Absidia cylindrospora]